MGYMHIENLYKNQEILLFKECYAMEKIHGTSAHIKFGTREIYEDNATYIGYTNPSLTFYSGGENHGLFVSLFDKKFLIEKFKEIGLDEITIYGEAYGGKQQGMRKTYGDKLKFIVFDVKVYDRFLSVPKAEEIAKQLGLEFVSYVKCSTDVSTLDLEKLKSSIQAKRNGILEDKLREGIVLRPLMEVNRVDGKRIIAKHKNDEFRETTSKRKVVDPKRLQILTEAKEIAKEWVTEMRLSHILDVFPEADITKTGYIIKAMVEDIKREAEKEVIWNKDVEKAISRTCGIMFKNRIKGVLK